MPGEESWAWGIGAGFSYCAVSQIEVLAGPRQFWGGSSSLKSPSYPPPVLTAAQGRGGTRSPGDVSSARLHHCDLF